MTATPWILLGILVLVILLALIAIVLKQKKKRPTDYYALFIMGIIWIPMGIPLGNPAFSAIGLVFALIGLKNKDKWRQNHPALNLMAPEEKRFKLTMIALSVLLLLAGIAFLFMFERGYF